MQLTALQVKILEFLTNAQIRAAQRLRSAAAAGAMATVQAGDDFLSAILKSKDEAAAGRAMDGQEGNIWGEGYS